MSSVVTIGFLDRTQICVQTEFTPPLADDERREILIHAAFLVARAFAALPPERQQTLATILREWVAKHFATCPVRLVGGDPMVGLPRFASTFLAPVREYALATNGCGPGAAGIEYFLPMAAAGFLRHLTGSEHDPAELLKPALALCAAVSIQPITVATHFKIATASLPKVDWVVERPEQGDLAHDNEPGNGPNIRRRLGAEGASRGLRERRWTLILSAALAALLIMAGVQFFSTLVPTPTAQPRVPDPASSADNPTLPAPSGSESGPSIPAPAPDLPGVVASPDPTPAKPARPAPSESTLAYLRALQDLAENSLAQVEVMVVASGRAGPSSSNRTESLDYGIRNLRRWQGRYDALTPPSDFQEEHRAVGRILADLASLGRSLPAPQTERTTRLANDRLEKIHADLERILGLADDRLP